MDKPFLLKIPNLQSYGFHSMSNAAMSLNKEKTANLDTHSLNTHMQDPTPMSSGSAYENLGVLTTDKFKNIKRPLDQLPPLQQPERNPETRQTVVQKSAKVEETKDEMNKQFESLRIRMDRMLTLQELSIKEQTLLKMLEVISREIANLRIALADCVIRIEVAETKIQKLQDKKRRGHLEHRYKKITPSHS